MIAYVTKNLWGYEQIHPVPGNLPEGMKPFYITDNPGLEDHLRSLGWNPVIFTDYTWITDKTERRTAVGMINAYPDRFVDLSAFDRVFVCDSNIITLPSNYSDFVNHDIDKACYTYSGYYYGEADNILRELYRSINSRWMYNRQGMEDATHEYLSLMSDLGIDYKKESVSSAKYLGWNLRHKDRSKVADYVVGEYKIHLQGNIILTIARVLFPDLVSNFRILNDDCKLSPHNFVA